MSLPNIDYSPLLDVAWWLLQWVFKWGFFLALLVFALVLIVGAGDLLKEAVSWGPGKRKKEKVTRTRE